MNDNLCKACGKKTTEIVDFGEFPLVNDFRKKNKKSLLFRLQLVVCEYCWCFQIADTPSIESLYTIYKHRSNASSGNIIHLESFFKFLEKEFNLNRDDLILEIGCNDGSLLNIFQKNGFKNYYGIDPARNLNQNNKNIFINFFNQEFVDDFVGNHGNCKFIIGLNVFAHNPNIIDFFSSVKKMLSDDGVFVFEVAYVFKTVLSGVFDTVYHEHVFNWSLTSLDYCLKSIGLHICNVSELPTQGGSLRIVCKKKYERNESVLRLLSHEKNRKVDVVTTYKKVDELIRIYVTYVFEKLKDYAYNDKQISLIGAPARGVVFLNTLFRYFPETRYWKFACGDDTPEKINCLFPGTDTILVEQISYNTFKSSEVALLLAWNYKEDLILRIRNLGLKFPIIVPFYNTVDNALL